jgi:hypothetical protein
MGEDEKGWGGGGGKNHTRLAFSPRGTVGFERKAAKFGLRSSVMLKANNSPSTFSRIPAWREIKEKKKVYSPFPFRPDLMLPQAYLTCCSINCSGITSSNSMQAFWWGMLDGIGHIAECAHGKSIHAIS